MPDWLFVLLRVLYFIFFTIAFVYFGAEVAGRGDKKFYGTKFYYPWTVFTIAVWLAVSAASLAYIWRPGTWWTWLISIVASIVFGCASLLGYVSLVFDEEEKEVERLR